MTSRKLLLGALVVLGVVATGVAASAAVPATAAETTPTYVERNVTENTMWTAEDGPYYVGGDLTITGDATLTVEPGTRVNVGEEVTITVEGSLIAAGTAADPIQFTTADASSDAGTWQTIEYAGDGDSTLRLAHAVVEHGTTAITATSSEGSIRLGNATVREHVRDGLAVTTRNGSPSIRITDSRFTDVGRAGVAFEVPETEPYVDAIRNVQISGTTFANTGANGVRVRARQISDVSMTDVTVAGVSAAGVAFETESTDARPQSTNAHRIEDVTLRRISVESVGGDGVAFRGGALDGVYVLDSVVRGASGSGFHVEAATDADRVRFARNTVVDARNGLQVALRRTTGGIQHVSLAVENNEFARNDRYGVDATAEYVFVDAFDVRNNTLAENGDGGATFATQQVDETVFADNVVRGNGGPGIAVSAVRVRGVTALRNRLVGNADDGLSVRASDLLGGVVVGFNDALDNDEFGVDVAGQRAGTTTEIHNNTIAANANGARVAGPTPARLANNSVVLNTADRERADGGRDAAAATGVVVENAPNVELVHNDVYGHIVGLRSSLDGGTVVAEHNYWGAESGPYHETLNPGGAGDAVVTDGGKVDPIPFASEPFGPRYERPTAVLAANETTVRPGEPVELSGRQSTDDGAIARYDFTVDGERRSGVAATHVTAFEEPGTYEVSLTVEDELGVRSLDDATVNVTVEPAERTTQRPTVGPTATVTTAPGSSDGSDGSLLASLFSLWGGLGALFYVLALVLGAYGTWLSVGGRDPPVRGTMTHVLAGVGVLTWAVAGFLGDGTLLTFAVGGAVAWGGLTAVVLALATR
ncbi:right-handed parallel beta-helix repeat-containing protein [Halobacterium sp. KA-6]|uniref:right-handed parallel beta-helix repeat-containing protein n=1 Tax=Halobacterium sp. KA-6 TaxID=2896368 RepID=UPI001E380500|nr:right-handed parallel beta-helix repeat-containing protein [Halobacterium sp. KA-6]MCD2202228.1 right-handed parallel beta-helix repeat-containing protein [Halobacterium sp. KA-6]